MKLRPYQSESCEAFFDALKSGLNPVVQLPTGSGKSLVIADICGRVAARGGKVVVLAHVQELLDQNEKEYRRYTSRNDSGIYSSGLNRFDVNPITFAGVQSVYKKPLMFQEADLILIDEAHTVPPDGEGLMYKSFLTALPGARRGGFTATPWRLGGGVIYGDDRAFDVLAYQKSPLELVEEGYLAPLVGVDTAWQLNLKGVSKTAGDFSMSSVQDKMQDADWLEKAVDHAVKQLKGRKHIVVFAPTVKTAQDVARLFSTRKVSCGCVSADSEDREDVLTAWKGGEIQAVANVDILTTGFNFPALDAMICFRPTESSALWVQMLGRGMRIAEGKTDCLVLDYVGNLQRLGGVSTMETWYHENDKGEREVGSVKPPASKGKQRIKSLALTNLDPMLDSRNGLNVNVLKVGYTIRPGKRAGKSLLLAVYDCETDDGIAISATQYVCVEYDGGARWHAQKWFKRRGSEAPFTARAAMVEAYSLPTPRSLKIRRNSGYINVENEYF